MQALHNSINKAISAHDGKFDHVLGPGFSREIVEMICICFNMDGYNPPGHKFGLLDCHHIWCFLCDPFNHE